MELIHFVVELGLQPRGEAFSCFLLQGLGKLFLIDNQGVELQSLLVLLRLERLSPVFQLKPVQKDVCLSTGLTGDFPS